MTYMKIMFSKRYLACENFWNKIVDKSVNFEKIVLPNKL